jgi:hypothetical protein
MKNLWTNLMRFIGFAPKKPTNIHHPIIEVSTPNVPLSETHICSMQQPHINSCAYGGGKRKA